MSTPAAPQNRDITPDEPANEPVLLEHATTSMAPAPTANAGWDPYEVWRTRVLLPPVQEPAAKPRAVEAEVAPLLRQTA